MEASVLSFCFRLPPVFKISLPIVESSFRVKAMGDLMAKNWSSGSEVHVLRTVLGKKGSLQEGSGNFHGIILQASNSFFAGHTTVIGIGVRRTTVKVPFSLVDLFFQFWEESLVMEDICPILVLEMLIRVDFKSRIKLAKGWHVKEFWGVAKVTGHTGKLFPEDQLLVIVSNFTYFAALFVISSIQSSFWIIASSCDLYQNMYFLWTAFVSPDDFNHLWRARP